MQSATIFNIQKFSLNDGPGIRTAVFLKGCPLRCAWCSNPESQLLAPELEQHEDGRVETIGETKTVEEVLHICLQDKPFYEDSGGGVTLSGGEALLWPDFCSELLEALHFEDIDTCIETTAYARPEVFKRISSLLDHLLIDMKHWNDNAHKQATGVSPKQCRENAASAIAAGKDVLIRIPIIPGYNDVPGAAAGFAERLREIGATRAQLLPYHSYGEKKYTLLGRTYAYEGVKSLRETDVEPLVEELRAQGIDAFV